MSNQKVRTTEQLPPDSRVSFVTHRDRESAVEGSKLWLLIEESPKRARERAADLHNDFMKDLAAVSAGEEAD